MIARLAEHEAFLRAIFDAPDDDTPRLVYADFLDETGDSLPPPHHAAAAARAELIRVQCESARLTNPRPQRPTPRQLLLARRETELARWLAAVRGGWFDTFAAYQRGFPPPERTARVSVAVLSDEYGLRGAAVTDNPEWFGAAAVRLADGPVTTQQAVEVLLGCPAFARVTEFDLRGQGRWVSTQNRSLNPYAVSVSAEFRHFPGVSEDGVAALARCRAARRLTALNLTGNDLGNTAAVQLARSPHLTNLARLDVTAGNRIGPRARQQLVDRFGADVVN